MRRSCPLSILSQLILERVVERLWPNYGPTVVYIFLLVWSESHSYSLVWARSTDVVRSMDGGFIQPLYEAGHWWLHVILLVEIKSDMARVSNPLTFPTEKGRRVGATGSKCVRSLEGIVSRDFWPLVFFHESNPSSPLPWHNLKPFLIQLRFRRDIQIRISFCVVAHSAELNFFLGWDGFQAWMV